LIWFPLRAGESSAWHRVRSEEVWLADTGVVTLERGGDESGPHARTRLDVGTGPDQLTQALVPADVWQRTLPSSADALVNCLVSPGSDFDDFGLHES
jgi:predicted cupin superfamily sugar epimerase